MWNYWFLMSPLLNCYCVLRIWYVLSDWSYAKMFYSKNSELKLRVILKLPPFSQFGLTREDFNILIFQILFFQLQFYYDEILYDSSLTMTEIGGLFPVCVNISLPILDTKILISWRFFWYLNDLFWLTLAHRSSMIIFGGVCSVIVRLSVRGVLGLKIGFVLESAIGLVIR